VSRSYARIAPFNAPGTFTKHAELDRQITGKIRSASLPTSLVLINGVFWLFFAANFVMVSQPYQPHVKHFEEESPPYIFWGHALPFGQFTAPFVRVAHLLEMPSFYTAAPFKFYCSYKGVVVDDLHFGVSEGGASLCTRSQVRKGGRESASAAGA
jgi:hypothetical protein